MPKNAQPTAQLHSSQFSSVTQLCLAFGNLMDCSPPGSSVHGSFQARVLERGAIAFSMLVCEMSAIVRSFEHSLALPFFGIGMKTDFSSPVATAGFSKCAGILSAALSQHHLLGFEISQLQSQHLH